MIFKVGESIYISVEMKMDPLLLSQNVASARFGLGILNGLEHQRGVTRVYIVYLPEPPAFAYIPNHQPR